MHKTFCASPARVQTWGMHVEGRCYSPEEPAPCLPGTPPEGTFSGEVLPAPACSVLSLEGGLPAPPLALSTAPPEGNCWFHLRGGVRQTLGEAWVDTPRKLSGSPGRPEGLPSALGPHAALHLAAPLRRCWGPPPRFLIVGGKLGPTLPRPVPRTCCADSRGSPGPARWLSLGVL